PGYEADSGLERRRKGKSQRLGSAPAGPTRFRHSWNTNPVNLYNAVRQDSHQGGVSRQGKTRQVFDLLLLCIQSVDRLAAWEIVNYDALQHLMGADVEECTPALVRPDCHRESFAIRRWMQHTYGKSQQRGS